MTQNKGSKFSGRMKGGPNENASVTAESVEASESDGVSDELADRQLVYCGGNDCDCDYSGSVWGGGGCKIVERARNGCACHCDYEGAWTCSGRVVRCSHNSAAKCKYPDISKEACKLGGGDCKGY